MNSLHDILNAPLEVKKKPQVGNYWLRRSKAANSRIIIHKDPIFFLFYRYPTIFGNYMFLKMPIASRLNTFKRTEVLLRRI